MSNNGGGQGLPNQRSLPGHSSAGRTLTAAAVCVRCGARSRFHEYQLAAAQPASVLARPLGRWWLYPGIPDSRAGRMRAPGPRLPLQVRVRVRRRTAAGPPGRPAIPCQCQSDCQRDRDADSTAGRFRLWAPLSRRGRLPPLTRHWVAPEASFVVLFLLFLFLDLQERRRGGCLPSSRSSWTCPKR